MVSFAAAERLLVEDERGPPTSAGNAAVEEGSSNISTRLEIVENTGSILMTTILKNEDGTSRMNNRSKISRSRSRHERSEDDHYYLQNNLRLWESPEQRAFVECLLERRAHYRQVRILSMLSICVVVVVICGIQRCISVFSQLSNTVGSSTDGGKGAATTTLYAMGIFCLVPLIGISWESQTQHTRVNEDIHHLTQKRIVPVPNPVPKKKISSIEAEKNQ